MVTRSIIALSLVAALGLASAAQAETRWQAHHPWRTHDNTRLATQNARIRAGVRDGQLTHAQARARHADDRAIRAEERADASVNGTHPTRRDQLQITRQENENSAAIYDARH